MTCKNRKKYLKSDQSLFAKFIGNPFSHFMDFSKDNLVVPVHVIFILYLLNIPEVYHFSCYEVFEKNYSKNPIVQKNDVNNLNVI